MLETISSVMSCSLCESHCSEEPLYLCGHVVCERCESKNECSACKFETNGNIPLSAKLIHELYDDLINISSERTSDVKTRETAKESYLHDSILERVNIYRNSETPLGVVNKGDRKTAEQTCADWYNSSSAVHSRATHASYVSFPLSPQTLSNYEAKKRTHCQHSRYERGRRRRSSISKRWRDEEDSVSRSVSDFSNETSDEEGRTLNVISSNISEHELHKQVNKINVLSTFDDADVLALVERYRCLSSENLADECSQKDDDTGFSDMPKLERQDIYQIDNLDFTEGERDMCNLEIEHDLYQMITSSNDSERKVDVNDTEQIIKLESDIVKQEIVEVENEIDERSVVDDDVSAGNNSLSKESAHSRAPIEEGHFEREDKISPISLHEQHPVNVTLQRTSDNCYKVKSISSLQGPINNSLNAFNVYRNEIEPERNNRETEEPNTDVNFVNMSSSEGYKTTSDNSSHAENSWKSRIYPKKRKKKFPKLKSFEKLNENSYDTTPRGFGWSRTNGYSSDGEEVYSTSDSDDSLNTQRNLYSVNSSYSFCYNKKTVKKLKRAKSEKRCSDQRVRSYKEMNQLDFPGFKEDEILSLSVKVLFFNSIFNPSSSLSFHFGEKEVIIRNRQSIERTFSGLPTELRTPNSTPNLNIVSPVHTVERIGSNATFYLDRSVIDTATVISSTPAPGPGHRSRRQLFHTPHIHNIHEFSNAEKDTTEEYNISCNRDVELKDDEIQNGIFGDAHTNVKRHTDRSSQTSPLSVQRVSSSIGSFYVEPRQSEFEDRVDRLSLPDNARLRAKEQDKNLCFAACGLTSSETLLLAKLARMSQSSLIRDFSHETTHLIMGEGGRGSNEYLLAIAYRAYIVTIDWVILCLRENTVLSPVGFIVGTEEGPTRCLEPVLPPFEGFYIFLKISPSVSNYSSYELTKTLCSLGGAKVILDHEKFNTFLYDEAYPRFFIFEDKSELNDLVLDKCKRLRVLPLSSMWVRGSIAAFKCQPILDYVGVVMSKNELRHEYHIPAELVHSQSNEES